MALDNMNRRSFLQATGAAAATSLATSLPFSAQAQQKTQLTGMIWGGGWIEGAKAIQAKQNKVDVNWELLTGGAATMIPKIKAAWPNTPYDMVAQFSPLYYTWDQEDWAEPLTFDEMPNLRDIAPDMFHRNKKGEMITVPLSMSGSFWGYRKDICPVEIKTMDDLFNPKLKGKVVVPIATQNLNSSGLSFSVAQGGNEKNMEPGWQYLKKLAQSGNIGRVANGAQDFANSLLTGETVAGYWNLAGWAVVVKQFPCEFLIRDKKQAPGFQVFTLNEAFLIPKVSKKKKETKEFLNFFINAENNESYNKGVGLAPTNTKSKPSDVAQAINFPNKADRDKFLWDTDYGTLASMRDEMIRRFETEIVPAIK